MERQEISEGWIAEAEDMCESRENEDLVAGDTWIFVWGIGRFLEQGRSSRAVSVPRTYAASNSSDLSFSSPY